MNLLWSKPYCGVQHLSGISPLDSRYFQISVEDHQTFTLALCLVASVSELLYQREAGHVSHG
jgi:hypothetical protein